MRTILDAKLKPLKYYLKSLSQEPTGGIDDTVGAILHHTQSSHQPVFIFDNTNKYLGVISPHQSLYRRHLPLGTRAANAIFHTPRVYLNDSIFRVTSLMLSTRLYKLPVVEPSGQILGIIQAQDILDDIVEDRKLLTETAIRVNVNSPITTSVDAQVKDIFTSLRKKKISRFILTNELGKIAGIVARSDIKDAYIYAHPRERFRKRAVPFPNYAFDEEEVYRGDDPITDYYTKNVFSAKEGEDVVEVIKKLISSTYHSLVVKDRANRPVGFISYRDLLDAFLRLVPAQEIPINFRYPTATISQYETVEAEKWLTKVTAKLDRIAKVEKVEVSQDEVKNTNGETILFETSIRLIRSGRNLYARAKGETFLISLNAAVKEIETQAQREHQDKKHIKFHSYG